MSQKTTCSQLNIIWLFFVQKVTATVPVWYKLRKFENTAGPLSDIIKSEKLI